MCIVISYLHSNSDFLSNPKEWWIDGGEQKIVHLLFSKKIYEWRSYNVSNNSEEVNPKNYTESVPLQKGVSALYFLKVKNNLVLEKTIKLVL